MITVLVVDDDPDVLTLTSDLLSADGYRVLQASDGNGALAIFERETEIRLIVTDVVMPGMNGLELAQRVKRHRPDMPILYVSGYPKDVIWDDRAIHGKLLSKPWRPGDLMREIKAALAG
jgi:CheY-like chemotaxis protein